VRHHDEKQVLQCVAVCCRVLQCVAVCCSVLQCAAVCCSVLQYVAGNVSMRHHGGTHQKLILVRVNGTNQTKIGYQG